MAQERHNWLVDGSHTSNVYGSIRIGGSSMAAREATEMGLIGPVTFIAVTAHGTCATGVARVNRDHTHTRALCFVGDKRSELPKCPGVARTTLLASNRDSCSNTLQIFERECLALRACLLYQRLADAVVDIFLKAVFTPGVPFQPPARPAGVCQLQAAAMLVATIPNALNLLPAVGLAIRDSGKIDDAKINAQVANWLISLGRGFRLGNAQIPHIITSNQFCAADLPGRIVQITPLEVAQDKLPNDTTCQCVERYSIQTHQAIGASIVTNAAVGGERRAGGMSIRARGAHRLSRFVSGTACQLRAKSVGNARLAIDEVVQLVFVRDTLFPRDRRAVACRCVKGSLRLAQGCISRRVNGEFTANGSYGERYTHKRNIPQSERLCKRRLMQTNVVSMRRYSFPPLPLKRRGFQLVRFR